jgi:lipopolysaccharide transport system ATP-binding protein
MLSEWAIRAENLAKCYTLFDRPSDRLKQMLARGRRKYYREFWSLREVSFDLPHGEVLGIIGKNGAGKSTLLQLICGTLTPTIGRIDVQGRIAALLELGAGFNPEFSGRENIFMNAAVMGIPEAEIAQRYEAIVSFSGIRDFIEQPVKTYSSGMYVRLAFSIATSINPDILVIDEALSVGDGQFARKSFERIMSLRDNGATILFCSHSMYQIEALCSHVIWLDGGMVRAQGEPATVIREYNAFLDQTNESSIASNESLPSKQEAVSGARQASITCVEVLVDGKRESIAHSGKSRLTAGIAFKGLPIEPYTVAIALLTLDDRWVASSSTANDGLTLMTDAHGSGQATIIFNPILLLRGVYRVRVWLLDAKGLFVHEEVAETCRITVEQSGLEQGLVSLPHKWELG